jgi:hypothetical protein
MKQGREYFMVLLEALQGGWFYLSVLICEPGIASVETAHLITNRN